MTVRPPEWTAPAALETNQSLLEDEAVTSLYHLTNNIGSLSFLFFLILLLFIFSHFLNKFTQFKKTKSQNFQNLHSVQPENRGFKKIFMPFFNMMGRVVSPPHFRKQNTLGVKYLRFKAVRKYIHLFHKNRDRMTT